MSVSDEIERTRPIGDAEFHHLRELIAEATGLFFGEETHAALRRRLSERLRALELSTLADYRRHFESRDAFQTELEAAVDPLTVKETYFFRQDYQLRAFQKEVFPEFLRAREDRRRLTVWSAGCSTGEEAYTLAMLVLSSGLFEGWNVRVIGTDLSHRAVDQARQGVYRESSFRTTPSDMRRRFFREQHAGAEVVEPLRRMCHFGTQNLARPGRLALSSQVDAIFCRNVMIYFDERHKRGVIDKLYDQLLPGGYLFLGHSESLLNYSTAFEVVHLSEDIAYRKPLAPARPRSS